MSKTRRISAAAMLFFTVAALLLSSCGGFSWSRDEKKLIKAGYELYSSATGESKCLPYSEYLNEQFVSAGYSFTVKIVRYAAYSKSVGTEGDGFGGCTMTQFSSEDEAANFIKYARGRGNGEKYAVFGDTVVSVTSDACAKLLGYNFS